MRTIKAGVWAVALMLSMAAYADTIEVDVNGLTCAFCVDSLQRQLKKMPDVEQVDVSLKSKRVRIVYRTNNIDIEMIRDIVINSGFTPVNIRKVDSDS